MSQATHTPDGWLTEIAEKAKVDRAVAKAVLDRHDIKPQAALPRRRPISFQRIALKGEKSGSRTDGSIDRTWSGLGKGLWTLTSDGNGRGKSSMLRLMMGALRGDWPQGIKDDVWKWLSDVEVDFTVDGIAYRAQLEKAAGSESKTDAGCSLYRIDGSNELEIYRGPPGRSFESAVNEVFQDELGFAEIKTFNKDTSSDVTQGWQAMASALYINSPAKAIFGEHVLGGIPLRLMQLFIGLPWISTYTQAITAAKMLEQKLKPTVESPALRGYRERLGHLEALLAKNKEHSTRESRRPQLRRRLGELDGMLVNLRDQIGRAQSQVDAEVALHTVTSSNCAEARRTLQAMKDEQAAGVVFRSLRPVCCPSCEGRIDDRPYAAGAPSCALCGSEQEAEAQTADRLADAELDVADLEKQTESAKLSVASARGALAGLERKRAACESEARQIGQELSQAIETDHEQEAIALRAQITQLQELIREAMPKLEVDSSDRAVVAAAATVTNSYFKDLQIEILRDVSTELTRLSQLFGVQNLASIEIQSGGTTKVMQGGADTTFSRMAPGERLRIRIAAALAVIAVSRARSYGRHPGLLILDSPANQEMTNEDFAKLIVSVRAVVDAAPDIQVVVGAVAKPELLDAVSKQRTRYARGDTFLF